MKNARRQNSICTANFNAIDKMIEISHTA